MAWISPLPGKVVEAAPTVSSGSVSEISMKVSSAVSGANVRYRQGKHTSKQRMQCTGKDGMVKFNIHGMTLSSQIKMKVMTTRHQLHMQLVTLNDFGLSLN